MKGRSQNLLRTTLGSALVLFSLSVLGTQGSATPPPEKPQTDHASTPKTKSDTPTETAQPTKPDAAKLRTMVQEARKLWDSGELKKARQTYEEVIHWNPREAWLRLEYGQALVNQGHFALARPHMQAAARLDPLNLKARLGVAVCLDTLGDTSGAIRAYKRVLLLNPGHEQARFNLGRLQYENAELTAAENTYNELLGRNPKHWKALNNLGTILLEQDYPIRAVTPLRRALKLRPGDPGVLYNLGRAYAMRQEFDRALSHFDKALEGWGANDLAAAKLHSERGNTLVKMNRRKEAVDAYRQALGLDNQFSPAHLSLGNLLIDMEKYEEAFEHLEKAVEFGGEHATLYNRIALHYLENNDLDSALTSLQKALKADLNNPDTNLLLSRVYKALGKLQPSLEALQKACKLGTYPECK